MMKAQKNKIAPVSVLYLLYISRIVVTLTYIQSVTTNLMNPDIMISMVIAMGLTIVFALPVIYCSKKHKNPVDVVWLGPFYSLYLIFAAALSISRFSYFASTTLNPDSQALLFVLVIGICALYAALLGIEGIARFSSFCFLMLVIAIATVFLCNIKNYNEINLYPLITNKTDRIFYNSLTLASNSMEIVLFLPLSKRVNGYAVRPLIRAVTLSYLTIIVLLLFVFGVMGDSAGIHSFPLYALFQLAKVRSFEKIDALHISFWIFGIFLKSAILFYCASICIKPFRQKNKCIACAAAAVIAALLLNEKNGLNTMTAPVQISLFILFAVVIPVLTLIFKKRNRGDELIEKF